MVEIKWTVQAADDLESIVNFISSDSVHYVKLLKLLQYIMVQGDLIPN